MKYIFRKLTRAEATIGYPCIACRPLRVDDKPVSATYRQVQQPATNPYFYCSYCANSVALSMMASGGEVFFEGVQLSLWFEIEEAERPEVLI